MFCPNCGNEMNDGASFCSNCGFQNTARTSNKKTILNQKRNARNNLPIVAVFVVTILLCIIGFNVFANRHCKLCDKEVFKDGLCRNHYTNNVVNDNVRDYTSGNKSFSDSLKDIYDKSYTKDEKKQIEDSINSIKDSFSSFFK